MYRRYRQWTIMTVLVLLVGAVVMAWPAAQANEEGGLVLGAPSFIKQTRTEEASVANIIQGEAGISAWYNASTAVNLDLIKTTIV